MNALDLKIKLSDAANRGEITREQEYRGMVEVDRWWNSTRAPMVPTITGLLVTPWCVLFGRVEL